MRVATYNVHRAVGADGRRSFGRVAEVLREIDADVIALQEVEGDREIEEFAGQEGYRVVLGPTLRDHRGSYGNVLLARSAPEAVERLDVSVLRREPRGAILARIDDAGPVDVLATHLGLRHFERQIQVKMILDALADRAAPAILLGDWNEWLPLSPARRNLRSAFRPGRWVRSYPTTLPLLPLDGPWVRGPVEILEVGAHRSPASQRASDHLPVVARIERRPERGVSEIREPARGDSEI